ncbi:MAG: hypothetical protein HYT36_02095 [Candidatus Staskawiczbacteria bacterium]|nr:hypothetical protein [Candidatus Staskawiczbacteria bacterium]
MDKKIIIMAVVAGILLATVFAAYLFWSGKDESPKSEILEESANTAEKITDNAVKGVLPSIETNALENKPNINPADNANPIKNIKTNPF